MKEIRERIEKTNDQRIKMALTLFNIMKNTGGHIDLNLRSTVAASMIEMLQTSMIAEDTDLIKLLNEGIDDVCNDVRTKYGINDFKSKLKSIIKDSKEQNERISTGEDILKSLNLNNVNLN